MTGWIKLHRSIQDNPLWLSEKFTRAQAWVDLLMLASFKDNFVRIAGRRIDLRPGQLCWSKLNLGKRWQWSRGKVSRFITELESDHRIEHQNYGVTTVITIINWEQYQTSGTPNGALDGTPDRSLDGALDGTQTKKVNKSKKENNDEEDGSSAHQPFNTLRFWQTFNCYTPPEEHWFFDKVYEIFTHDFISLCVRKCKDKRRSLGHKAIPCKSDIHEWLESNKSLYAGETVYRELAEKGATHG